jgi:hypothetical protein
MAKCNLRWRQRIYHVALGCVYIAGKFNEETQEPMVKYNFSSVISTSFVALNDLTLEKDK